MTRKIQTQAIDARSALTPTGGFLRGHGKRGYTHTFNPALGCAFAQGFCGHFCYARDFAERLGGRGTWGKKLMLKKNTPGLLAKELNRALQRPPEHPHHIGRLRVFSASATDPCAPELLELYRQCLRAVADYPIARWVIQTRSPAVLDLKEEILALGERVLVSFTLETDAGALWQAGPGGAPGIEARRRTFEAMASWPIRRHLAVAPCLPLQAPEHFAHWISELATEATVDTFCAGDGSSGQRTAASALPTLLQELGYDWRDEAAGRHLFRLLQKRMGTAVAWSKEGFLRLAY